MKTRLLALRGLAAGMLAPLLAGAGCTARLDSDEARAEAVGSAEQADPSLSVSAPYPGLDPLCAKVSDNTFHNPEWPSHSESVCGESFGVQDALVKCGGAVKYFSYSCADFDVGSAWTAYVGCCAPCSNGTGINLETRSFVVQGSGPSSSAEAKSLFYSLPVGTPGSGYGYDNTLTSTAAFSNHTSIPGGTPVNIAYHLKVSFLVNLISLGTWSFRLGPDFGYGGALLVDGKEVQARWFPHNEGDGMYWGGIWGSNDPSVIDDPNVLKGAIDLGHGLHDLEVFGFENGDDALFGPLMRLEFLAPGADFETDWAPISTSALGLCGR